LLTTVLMVVDSCTHKKRPCCIWSCTGAVVQQLARKSVYRGKCDVNLTSHANRFT